VSKDDRFPRLLRPALEVALRDSPIVVLVGPRQAGKTTLVRELVPDEAAYADLDDPAMLDRAQRSPKDFLASLPIPAVVDEVQRAPGLILPLKSLVDRDRRPGRVLLTGSADPFAPHAAPDSLAGRTETLTLWPLSEVELRRTTPGFIDRAFAGEWPRASIPGSRSELIRLLVRGHFPAAVARAEPERRAAWYRDYANALAQRDVPGLARISSVGPVATLLRLLAARTAGLVNRADLARDAGLPASTLGRYLDLLHRVFVFHLTPAWFRNVGKRLTKMPKLHLVDTGLAAALLGLDAAGVEADASRLGALAETFVAMELLKQASWHRARPTLHHFRTEAGAEVDLVLEAPDGAIVAIEVKASTDFGERDLRGLRMLAEIAGKRFARGILLHAGRLVQPLGPKLVAAPIGSLWT
jgi:hypothetical protein